MNWDRVERLLGQESLEQLGHKRVAIIGLGSGGGFVATALAMSGVRHFVLIDNQKLAPENIVRHMADQRDLGRFKVDACADLIRYRNSDARVETATGRLEEHLHLLDGVDLVLSAVDGEGSKFSINEYCLEKHIPAIYAGVYERGEGGDVVTIQPQAGPCYACWASTLREGYISPPPDGSKEIDYGLINERGTLDAEPGLWLHVVRVASVQADLALNWLLRNTPAYRKLPGNTVILANTALEIIEGEVTPPYSAVWVNIERNPDCMICGHRHSIEQSPLTLDGLASDLLMSEQGKSDAES